MIGNLKFSVQLWNQINFYMWQHPSRDSFLQYLRCCVFLWISLVLFFEFHYLMIPQSCILNFRIQLGTIMRSDFLGCMFVHVFWFGFAVVGFFLYLGFFLPNCQSMRYSKTSFLLALMAIHCGEKIKELRFIILSGRFLNKLPLPSKGNTKRLFVA